MPNAIFVLDDEPGILNLARHTLEDAGFQVYTAGSGKEAREVCERYGSEWSAGVFDIEVSGMTVPKLDSLVRNHFLNKGVVFMSGYPEDATADLSAETLQWSEFLMKPFLPQELLGAVTRAVARTSNGGILARNA